MVGALAIKDYDTRNVENSGKIELGVATYIARTRERCYCVYIFSSSFGPYPTLVSQRTDRRSESQDYRSNRPDSSDG
jgi:hypothetical protein